MKRRKENTVISEISSLYREKKALAASYGKQRKDIVQKIYNAKHDMDSTVNYDALKKLELQAELLESMTVKAASFADGLYAAREIVLKYSETSEQN